MTIGGIHGIHGFHGSRAHSRLDTFPFHRPAMVDQYPDIGPDTAMGIGSGRRVGRFVMIRIATST